MGVTLEGQGYRKLTQGTITKLTAYYGKAIHAHLHDLLPCSLHIIMQYPLMISRSTHTVLPLKTVCSSSSVPRQLGRSLALNSGTPLLPEGATRCLRGDTQNRSETLHSMIWGKCPKTDLLDCRVLLLPRIREWQNSTAALSSPYTCCSIQWTLCQANTWGGISCEGQQSTTPAVIASGGGQHERGTAGTTSGVWTLLVQTMHQVPFMYICYPTECLV